MYELIITEKPSAAKKIAEALADGKAIREGKDGVYFYKLTHGKKDIIVSCAVGHLYGLAEKKDTKRKEIPAFSIEWVPAYDVSKGSAHTRKYLTAIKKLALDASEFTIATDYDVEGEVIGLNIIRYACKRKDAARMKFSTLTRDELREAYANKSRRLDWGQAKAGETRHFLDWYNGINYSRALTAAIKKAGAYKLMSTGRVQGPALKIIVEREKDIQKFRPEPFWQIELNGEAKKGTIAAWHEKDKFWKEDDAAKVMQSVKGKKEGTAKSVDAKQFKHAPPNPFDLTSLQIESYRCHGISPKDTLAIAQELYTGGFISYPRTSSNQLPAAIGYRKILTQIARNSHYAALANALLKEAGLTPNNGSKTDAAHPAIYPTGIIPDVAGREHKLYDLIVRRFLATFAKPATRETVTITIEVNNEYFIAKGTRTLDMAWHEYYRPYVRLDEVELPKVAEGDAIAIKKITKHQKETQPPKRYTPASIIKELEKLNLGTKATRAEIIDTLFKRGYVDGKTIEATQLGIRTIETLAEHCPKIIDEALTSHFEEEMEKIRESTTDEEKVLADAKKAITEIIRDFKKNELSIGKKLLAANIETRDEQTTLGNCPACKDGKLQIRRGKYGAFAACNRYPECKTTFSLPKSGLSKPAKKACEHCGMPMIVLIRQRKKPQELCVNQDCPSKKIEGEAGKELRDIEKGKVEKECPECKEGKLVVRNSIYGKFLGCERFPKCRHTESIAEGPLKEDFKEKGKDRKKSK